MSPNLLSRMLGAHDLLLPTGSGNHRCYADRDVIVLSACRDLSDAGVGTKRLYQSVVDGWRPDVEWMLIDDDEAIPVTFDELLDLAGSRSSVTVVRMRTAAGRPPLTNVA